jgi:hypothetical protein
VQASGIAAMISTSVPRTIRRRSSGLDTNRTFLDSVRQYMRKGPGGDNGAKRDDGYLNRSTR